MDEKLVLLLMVLNDDEIEQIPNIFDSTGKRFWKEEREIDQLWFWVSEIFWQVGLETGKGIKGEKSENKVIRPKLRASSLSKRVRQTDRHIFFFKKTFEMAIYSTKFLFYH